MNSRRHGSLWAPSLETIYHKGVFLTAGAGGLPTISPPATAAKSLQLCPALCDPIGGLPPGSSVHGIFQAEPLWAWSG